MNQPLPFLPITKKEMDVLGWDTPDVILITGDAYVDHSAFGSAIIGRLLEKEGYKVAILPQPNWQDDLRDFKKLGKPKLFFGITAGNMDSMLNHYTASKRLRSDDAYTAGGQAGFRPDYATIIYSKIIKQLYPDVPIVLGGIEASMRRLSHYDYWKDTLNPSILVETQADILIYGMGEKAVLEITPLFQTSDWKEKIKEIPQIAYIEKDKDKLQNKKDVFFLHSYQKELESKKYYGENFVVFETESNKLKSRTLIQPYLKEFVVINPPNPVPSETEMDMWALYDRMQNEPHPKYTKRGKVPAFEMIRNSIAIHRGCFGGCSFCTISAHQGKQIASRSEISILKEVEHLTQRKGFKGHISDLGGPSANMYKMGGINPELCQKCCRLSCLSPKICRNLNIHHQPLIQLYQKAMKIKGVKKITIGSGIRYEMLLADNEKDKENALSKYLTEVVKNHVSGRLKVAPEHTSDKVTLLMRKPSFKYFLDFLKKFYAENRKAGKIQQLIPYFISAHPGCRMEDMQELKHITKYNNLITNQVQLFTPSPMTFSTAIYYLGYNPYTNEKIFVERDLVKKKMQHQHFF